MMGAEPDRRSVTRNGSVPLFETVPIASLPITSIATTADVATAIRTIMDDLSVRYPDATDTQRIIVAALEIQQMAKRDDAFKLKLVEALQSGSLLIDQILSNNPFLKISGEMVSEWLDAVPAVAQI
ncbi:MAG: hypothetical protein HC852_15760 [Acaryochloridaceae cyanobacterium RU_4_10]|nr:hypothetical protein [Acaryochloridaceae cyanobacterium RU_4_10]